MFFSRRSNSNTIRLRFVIRVLKIWPLHVIISGFSAFSGVSGLAISNLSEIPEEPIGFSGNCYEVGDWLGR